MLYKRCFIIIYDLKNTIDIPLISYRHLIVSSLSSVQPPFACLVRRQESVLLLIFTDIIIHDITQTVIFSVNCYFLIHSYLKLSKYSMLVLREHRKDCLFDDYHTPGLFNDHLETTNNNNIYHGCALYIALVNW